MPSYLAFTLVLCVLAALVIVFSKRRKLLLISGVAAAPAGLLDTIFTPEYWDAGQVFGADFSIEGVLFSFANGVLIAWLAFAPWRAAFIQFYPGRALMRAFLIAAPAWFVFLLLWHNAIGLADWTVMHASLAGLAIALLFLLALRRGAWPLAVVSGIGFFSLYLVELLIWQWLDSSAPAFWNTDTAWGLYFLGFPAEELVWAGLYGAVWALAVAYGASVHLRPKLKRQRSKHTAS